MEVMGLSCCGIQITKGVRNQTKCTRDSGITHLRERLDMVPVVALAGVDPNFVGVQTHSNLYEYVALTESRIDSTLEVGDVRERSALKAWQVIGLCWLRLKISGGAIVVAVRF